MNAKRNVGLVLTTLVASLVLCGPLSAQDRAHAVPSKTVRYSDLDLTTPHGIHTLYERIQNAAWALCLDIVPPTGPTFSENLKCRRTLVEAAVVQVNNPALSALLPDQGRSKDLTAKR